jgi:lipopolysaccharide export system protein LptC
MKKLKLKKFKKFLKHYLAHCKIRLDKNNYILWTILPLIFLFFTVGCGREDTQVTNAESEKITQEIHTFTTKNTKRGEHKWTLVADVARYLESDQVFVENPVVTIFQAGQEVMVITGENGEIGCFKITEQSLANLKSSGVPNEVLEKLESMKNQHYVGKNKFLAMLKEAIGEEQTVKYKSLILENAQNRENLRIIGNPVTGVSTDGIIYTNELYWESESEKLYTREEAGEVQITRGDSVMFGKEMEADPKLEVVTLKKVRFTVYPKDEKINETKD